MSIYNGTIYALVEVALEVLVGVVDEQLLEAIGVELLEAVDVQHADEAPHVADNGNTRRGFNGRDGVFNVPGGRKLVIDWARR